MGYTTSFYGSVSVDPPLSDAEREYLEKFCNSRRMERTRGPYYAEPGENFGQDDRSDVFDGNQPPQGQPGLWCHWIANEDGTAIEWDDGEKFYDAAEWMQYIIDHFLKPGATAKRLIDGGQPEGWPILGELFKGFTFDHKVNGQIEAEGESGDDRWLLVVEDNVVSVRSGHVVYEDAPEADLRAAERKARPNPVLTMMTTNGVPYVDLRGLIGAMYAEQESWSALPDTEDKVKRAVKRARVRQLGDVIDILRELENGGGDRVTVTK